MVTAPSPLLLITVSRSLNQPAKDFGEIPLIYLDVGLDLVVGRNTLCPMLPYLLNQPKLPSPDYRVILR